MATRTFIEKWVLNTRTENVHREIDPYRSVYPPLVTSGYHAWGASQANTSILTVPSSKRFVLEAIFLNNENGTPNKVMLYDGPGTSVPVFPIQIGGSTTEFIFGLKWVFQSAVHASNLDSNIQIRVQGVLITSE